ncbi:PH domain-containing protein [Fodinibius sp.]|uniref:PH domain-containing protein n=1 Tax=Fodinibius sp. TaxID=1872440 RepID=UPI002ACE0055|nr:PH domain-containing protein [Fodinibius sp.]MDZ7657679.1 PH domain-containing protein [Fodinibius sp.]
MEEIRKTFKAPWDWLLILMTSGITLLLLGLNYYTPDVITTLITWAIILGALGFGIFGYHIEGGKLKILRLGWSKDIDISNITDVEYRPHAMTGSVRTFGIGGLFGYVGYFRNSILKSYKAYVTHRNKTVVLTTKDGDIVISPDDPETFVASLKSILKDN